MSDSPTLPAGQLLRLAAIVYLVMAVAAVVWLGSRRGAVTRDWFWAPGQAPVELALGFALAATTLMAWGVLRRLSPLAGRLEARLAEVLAGLGREEAWALALLSGLAEELFFRGAVQESWGFWVATLAFAALHTGRGPELRLWTGAAFVIGAALGLVVLWRQSLLAAIVAHVVINAVQLRRLAGAAPTPAP